MKPVLENAAGSNQPETFGGKFKIPNSKVVTKKNPVVTKKLEYFEIPRVTRVRHQELQLKS